MSIIGWIVVGALAGWLASAITNTSEGLVGNIAVGIIGALVGGFILGLFGSQGVTGFNLPSLLTAVLGSVILLLLVKTLRRTSS